MPRRHRSGLKLTRFALPFLALLLTTPSVLAAQKAAPTPVFPAPYPAIRLAASQSRAPAPLSLPKSLVGDYEDNLANCTIDQPEHGEAASITIQDGQFDIGELGYEEEGGDCLVTPTGRKGSTYSLDGMCRGEESDRFPSKLSLTILDNGDIAVTHLAYAGAPSTYHKCPVPRR